MQALASAIFLFSIILLFLFINFNFSLIFYNFILISSTIILKRGAAPFHFWFPRVIEGLNWNSNFLLITWQKIAPIIILSYSLRFNLIVIIILLSIIFGSLGGINQTSLRKLLAFSSINHLGWILAGIINNETIWLTYFIFYRFLNFRIVYLFNSYKLFNINQTFKIFLSNKFSRISLFLLLISLGGLPPFLGFFPKWLIIELLVKNNLFFLLTIILFLTLITLYFYLRIAYAALLINHISINWSWKRFNPKNFSFLIFINFLSISGLFLINIFYIFI